MRNAIEDPKNWDAVMIALPAAICPGSEGASDVLSCLSHGAQLQLERDLQAYVTAGYLLVGAAHNATRPGSSLVLLRQLRLPKTGVWSREFFCQDWTSPNTALSIVSVGGGQGGGTDERNAGDGRTGWRRPKLACCHCRSGCPPLCF